MTADDALLGALKALAAALGVLGQPAMIIGGIAVIARGVPRLTIDIDATVAAADLDLGQVVATLATHGITPRVADAVDFARTHQVLLLRHEPTGTPLEVSLAWLPFEIEALARVVQERRDLPRDLRSRLPAVCQRPQLDRHVSRRMRETASSSPGYARSQVAHRGSQGMSSAMYSDNEQMGRGTKRLTLRSAPG